MSSEPEEPHLRSEPNILSPASPKPIHFPTPANIPVLEMQMDVRFNQTEAHMADPALPNPEVRADFWRDPNEITAPAEDHASPYSTGGEALQLARNEGDRAETLPESTGPAPVEMGTVSDEHDHPEPVPISASQPNHPVESDAQPSAHVPFSSDPSVPAADVTALNPASFQPEVDAIHDGEDARLALAQSSNSNVDVQALLDTLQTAPASASGAYSNANAEAQADALQIATALSPTSQLQAQQTPSTALPLPPGVEGASSPLSAAGLGLPPSGLPPRPPPQEQPLIHPNYVHSQHIRDYHPHAANPAFQPHVRSGSQGNTADPNSKNYVPPVHSPSSANVSQSTGYPPNIAIPGSPYVSNGQQAPVTGGGGGSVYTPNSGQNTNLAASPQNFYGVQYPSQTNTPIESRRERSQREGGDQGRPEDRPWDSEVQRKYDRFIEDERRYVSEGRWEQFPQGSRLFVGNLSSEKVTKRDIFHVFHTYGDLAQISIKQAYGFVQFLRTEDCMRALEREQGTQIRDKKIHLEVSKPQKNRTQNAQRRSRSPPDNARGRPGSNVDRYVSGSRGANNRGNYSGYRSPSPRGYRDRYDDRYRRRSRSPDYKRGGGGGGGGRFRSPSPRREAEDDLPLPRRAQRDVPDVQIIVLDSLDRDFISWVEQAFSTRGVRVDVLLLSPRLSEQAVVRRQIVEGVVAVVKLTRQNQNMAKIGLQIFDRRQGAGNGNVQFEEYEGLEPSTAVELVMRAKQAYGAASTPHQMSSNGYGAPAQQYGLPSAPAQLPQQNRPYSGYGAQQPPPPPGPGSYGQQQQQPPMPPSGYPPGFQVSPPAQGGTQGVPPNLQNLITNLDPNNLQSLLSAMSSTSPQSANAINAYAQNPSHPPPAAVAALQSNPALAGYLQQQHQQQQQQQGQGGAGGGGGSGGGGGGGGQINMQEILARLGTGHQR